jgi:aminobenzoyl-glutamate utilization protein B
VEQIFDWMKKIAEGAALMTETRMSFDMLAATYEVLPNSTLCKVGADALKRIGPPPFNEEDQKYGEEIVKSLNVDLKGGKAYSTTIEATDCTKKFPDVPVGKHSTDQGNVTWIAPTMSFGAANWAYKTPGHSWQLVCQGKTEAAEKAGLQASKWMAASALALFADEKTLEQAKAEHAEYLNQFPYKDPVKGLPVPTFKKLYGMERDAVPGRSIR